MTSSLHPWQLELKAAMTDIALREWLVVGEHGLPLSLDPLLLHARLLAHVLKPIPALFVPSMGYQLIMVLGVQTCDPESVFERVRGARKIETPPGSPSLWRMPFLNACAQAPRHQDVVQPRVSQAWNKNWQ